MKMNKTKTVMLGLCVLVLSQCGGLGTTSTSGGGSSGSSSTTSDESNVEAAYTSAIDSVTQSASSSTEASGSLSLTSSQQYLTTRTPGDFFHCADSSSVEQSFSCDNTDGSVERSAIFTDCELTRDSRSATLSGSITHTITNGGDGLCEASQTFSLANMVMGRDGEDSVHSDAVQTHQTAEDGMVFSFVNARGLDATVTVTHDNTITFSDPVDENSDGMAESVTSTVERNDHFVQAVNGTTKHDVNVFTAATDYTTVDIDGVTSGTISVTLPTHTLNFDSDGVFTGRTIESGNLIVDHNVAGIRMIMGVGEEGLTFDDGTTCGPVSGTMTSTGYTLNSDGTLGDVIGTGTITFEDGEVTHADFAGEDLTLKRLPCH